MIHIIHHTALDPYSVTCFTLLRRCGFASTIVAGTVFERTMWKENSREWFRSGCVKRVWGWLWKPCESCLAVGYIPVRFLQAYIFFFTLLSRTVLLWPGAVIMLKRPAQYGLSWVDCVKKGYEWEPCSCSLAVSYIPVHSAKACTLFALGL